MLKIFLFPPKHLSNYLVCIQWAFLSPLSKDVNEFNKQILEILPEEKKVYFSYDSIAKSKDNKQFTHTDALADYLSLSHESGILSHKLELKFGCIYSLARNLSLKKVLVKNTRVVVRALHQYSVEIEVSTSQDGELHDHMFCLQGINFDFRPGFSPWIVRRQFPLQLAYATTFSSCQGLTLDRIVVDF